jgi:hypothetical protein
MGNQGVYDLGKAQHAYLRNATASAATFIDRGARRDMRMRSYKRARAVCPNVNETSIR